MNTALVSLCMGLKRGYLLILVLFYFRRAVAFIEKPRNSVQRDEQEMK